MWLRRVGPGTEVRLNSAVKPGCPAGPVAPPFWASTAHLYPKGGTGPEVVRARGGPGVGMSGGGVVCGVGGLGSLGSSTHCPAQLGLRGPSSPLRHSPTSLQLIPKSSMVGGPIPHSSWLEFY